MITALRSADFIMNIMTDELIENVWLVFDLTIRAQPNYWSGDTGAKLEAWMTLKLVIKF